MPRVNDCHELITNLIVHHNTIVPTILTTIIIIIIIMKDCKIKSLYPTNYGSELYLSSFNNNAIVSTVSIT